MADFAQTNGCNRFGHVWVKDFFDGADVPSIRCNYCGVTPTENGENTHE